MKIPASALCLAILAQTALFAAPVAFAQDSTSPPSSASPAKSSAARQAIQWSQDQLTELDATIAALEQDAAKLRGDARGRAETALKKLREKRDAYRAQADEAVANTRTWTESQAAVARKSLEKNWTAFQTATDEYLETTKADLATRRAVLEAELDARQKAWQKSIDELRAKADKLADEQRAAIKARIDALSAQADEAKARVGRLRDASGKAWNTAKKSSADAQRLFFDTYASIRKSIDDATK
jgi:chromosome segregation ATPase